ncbi:hypothetical protein E2C01_007351 [Portunus trituberculatus]|uniref:Uncharacterized protein n=1 Tax=Portunus trituberculatus TaxID=210409 RepID=A0A5B7D0X9_PORTR|nr:hypothetical protein [Portunus trituberculatus]
MPWCSQPFHPPSRSDRPSPPICKYFTTTTTSHHGNPSLETLLEPFSTSRVETCDKDICHPSSVHLYVNQRGRSARKLVFL